MTFIVPSILEPNFDLLRFNVREDRTFSDKLLTAHWTWFRTIMIKPLKGFNLLRCIPDILSVIQHHRLTILAGSHFFLNLTNLNALPLMREKKKTSSVTLLLLHFCLHNNSPFFNIILIGSSEQNENVLKWPFLGNTKREDQFTKLKRH